MPIKIGPAGIGPLKEVEKTFEEYMNLGIKSAEIPFTYGVYIRKTEDALKVKTASEKFGISLSVHAPYWINLNSEEKEKVEASKKRILGSCKIADWLTAEKVVFHCGFFGKKSKEESYKNIRDRIIEMKIEIIKKKWKVKLAPETMGKVNIFGSAEEISKLIRDTNCSFCLDFAHILARDKKIEWKKIEKLFPQKNWHCHFSGIEYNEKGEKRHTRTKPKYWKYILENLPKDKKITIINESPSPVRDCIEGLKIINVSL